MLRISFRRLTTARRRRSMRCSESCSRRNAVLVAVPPVSQQVHEPNHSIWLLSAVFLFRTRLWILLRGRQGELRPVRIRPPAAGSAPRLRPPLGRGEALVHLPRVAEDEIEDVELVLGVHPDVGLVARHAVEGLGALFALVEASVPPVHHKPASTARCHLSRFSSPLLSLQLRVVPRLVLLPSLAAQRGL